MKREPQFKNLKNLLEKLPLKHFPYLRARTEKAFEQKLFAEAVITLYGLIELQLTFVWVFFLKTRLNIFISLESSLSYNIYVEILDQVKIINKSQKSKLLALQKARNSVAHIVTNKLKGKKISINIISDQFKKGVDISIELDKILNKIAEAELQNDLKR